MSKTPLAPVYWAPGEIIEEKVIYKVANPLPVGTLIRATLDQSIITGSVVRISIHGRDRDTCIDIRPDGALSIMNVSLWLSTGWKIEVIAEVAPEVTE